MRRKISSIVFALCLSCSAELGAQTALKEIDTIAFGSCMSQNGDQSIWGTIAAAHPNLLVLMGDNIYADHASASKRALEYGKIKSNPLFKALTSSVELLATWDDHDYAYNDAGKEYSDKRASQKAFLDFVGARAEDPRRKREGVYSSQLFSTQGKILQLVLLDTRYFRDAIEKAKLTEKESGKPAPYLPNLDPKAQLLGAEQWRWLESTLAEPADIRVIVSSIQIIADSHPFEKWANFPLQRKKFFELLKRSSGYFILLSGDRHFGEIANYRAALEYPLYEITSSSLNSPKAPTKIGKNQYRVFETVKEANFGLLSFHRYGDKLGFKAALVDQTGTSRNQVEILIP